MRIAPTCQQTSSSAAVRIDSSWRSAARGAVMLALAFGLLTVLWLLLRPLVLLFAAVVIAEALAPAVDWLQRWLPRTLAVVLLYLLIFLLIGVLIWFLVPTLFAQATAVLVNLPALLDRVRSALDRIAPFVADHITSATGSGLGRLSSTLLSLPLLIASAALEIALVVVMSIYWLIVSPKLYSFALSLVPEDHRRAAGAVLNDMASVMGGFVRATVINGLIVGTITYVGLLVIGIEFPLVLALVAGVGEMIPVVGPILAGVPAVLIAFLNGSLSNAVVVLLFYVAVQQVENHVLVPYVMKLQANVTPLLAVFALFVGAEAGGMLGALIAIPLAGVLQVLATRVLAPIIRRWTGATGPDGADGAGGRNNTRMRAAEPEGQCSSGRSA